MKRYVALVMCRLIFLFATSIRPAASSDEEKEPTVVYNDDGSVTVIGAESEAEASALVREDMNAKKAEAKQAFEEAVMKRSASGDVDPTESECKPSAPGFVYKITDYFGSVNFFALLLTIISSIAFLTWLSCRSKENKVDAEFSAQKVELESVHKGKAQINGVYRKSEHKLQHKLTLINAFLTFAFGFLSGAFLANLDQIIPWIVSLFE